MLCNFVIPFPLLAIKKLRSISTAVIASCCVVVGMWLERFLIIVPSLARKSTSYSWGTYTPQWPEIIIMVASFAAMALLYVLVSKLVPIISIWELKVGEHPKIESPGLRAGRRSDSRWGTPMKAIYGLYNTPDAAQRAFDGLRAEGLPTRGISIMSSEPLEEWEFASHDHETVMPWIAVIGGGLGLIVAYLLTAITQEVWPINTGGMPIVTNWTNIIVMFELTMLGAVLATVFTLFMTARLPRKLPKLYDPAISNGRILIGVANPQDSQLDGIERVLVSTNAEIVRKLG